MGYLYTKAAKLTAVVLAFVSLSIGVAMASQHTVWSFTDNPHPFADELTATEKKLEVDLISSLPVRDYCQAILRAQFQIYSARYPEFSESGNPESNFKSWKAYLLRAPGSGVGDCKFNAPLDALDAMFWDSRFEPQFYFCGVYSRSPSTEAELEIAALIDEMMENARFGLSLAFAPLLIANEYKPTIALNADIEYYFRRALKRDLLLSALWDTSQLEPLLDDERLAFVKQAVEDRDFAAVLATTPPCTPR